MKTKVASENSSFAGAKHDLSGYAALDFVKRDGFVAFAQTFAGCNPERFKPIALRLFVKNGTPVITLYALDVAMQARQKGKDGKLPVRKFKIELSFADLLQDIKQFDFTVLSPGVDVTKLVVDKK